MGDERRQLGIALHPHRDLVVAGLWDCGPRFLGDLGAGAGYWQLRGQLLLDVRVPRASARRCRDRARSMASPPASYPAASALAAARPVRACGAPVTLRLPAFARERICTTFRGSGWTTRSISPRQRLEGGQHLGLERVSVVDGLHVGDGVPEASFSDVGADAAARQQRAGRTAQIVDGHAADASGRVEGGLGAGEVRERLARRWWRRRARRASAAPQ